MNIFLIFYFTLINKRNMVSAIAPMPMVVTIAPKAGVERSFGQKKIIPITTSINILFKIASFLSII